MRVLERIKGFVWLKTRKQYLKRSFRPVFKREKQFRNGAIATEKENCRINLTEQI